MQRTWCVQGSWGDQGDRDSCPWSPALCPVVALPTGLPGLPTSSLWFPPPRWPSAASGSRFHSMTDQTCMHCLLCAREARSSELAKPCLSQ